MPKAIIVLSTVCSIALIDSAHSETYSWGKPGSSRAASESGSRKCLLKVARRDVSGDMATRKLLRGFEVLERQNNMPPMPEPPTDDPNVARGRRQVLSRQAYQPDRHVDSLQFQLQHEVDRCLVSAGYIRFALLPKQERYLRRLKPNTEQRRAYLYALGSDRRIVAAQKVEN